MRTALVLGALLVLSGCSDEPSSRDVEIQGVVVQGAGSRLLVEWAGGGCDEVDSTVATVVEDDDVVTVTVRVGVTGEETCSTMGYVEDVLVDLDDPLGSRAVRDGSTGDEVPVRTVLISRG